MRQILHNPSLQIFQLSSLGNDWRTNVTENSVTFRGVAFTVFVFTNFEDLPLTLEGPVVVTFFMSPTIHNNPIINLFASSDVMKPHMFC